jgi:hypothetical protein
MGWGGKTPPLLVIGIDTPSEEERRGGIDSGRGEEYRSEEEESIVYNII